VSTASHVEWIDKRNIKKIPSTNHNHTERAKGGKVTSEAAISQEILSPALHKPEWPVFYTSTVIPGFSVADRSAD